MFSNRNISLALVGVAVTLVTCAGAASAQGRRGGFGGRAGGLMLLRNKSVQTELGMTQPQIEKVDAKQQEVMQQMRDAFQNAQGDPNARQAAMAQVQEINNKAVADILDSKQQKRFKEIELQIQGPQAINNPAVQQQLGGLSDQQKSDLAAIQQQQRDAMQAARPAGGFQNMTPEERQQMFQKMQDVQKQFAPKYLAVLNTAQKAKWNELTGKPFAYVPEAPQPRGGAR